MLRRVIQIMAVALFLGPFSLAAASLPAALVKDLSPLAATVLLDRQGEVLIDLRAEAGVRVGDLFSVISAGQEVRDPQSGALLGTLDQVVGVLQLVELRPGFSIARRLSGSSLQPGAAVHRFERLPLTFIDPAGDGEPLFVALRDSLRHLGIQEYRKLSLDEYAAGLADSPSLGLVIVHTGSGLEVRGPDLALLQQYPLASPVPPQVAAAAAVPAQEPPAQGLTAKWLGASTGGVPVGLALGDFDGDGQVETVRAFADRVEIGRLVAGEFSSLAQLDLGRGLNLIALVAGDLNANGRAELYLTIVEEDRVRSQVVEYDGGDYRQLAEDLPWFFNLVRLPEEGEVLLGQARDRSHGAFSSECYRFHWQGGELRQGAAFAIPGQGPLYSLVALPAAGKNRFVRINSEGHLALLDASGGALWVSEVSGDSETAFLQADAQNPGFDEEFLHRVFLPPALIAGPGDTVISALSSGITGTARLRQLRSASLTGWQWRNQTMQPLWQLPDVEGYVPALAIGDADNDGQPELVVPIVHQGGLFSKRTSVLKLYDLDSAEGK